MFPTRSSPLAFLGILVALVSPLSGVAGVYAPSGGGGGGSGGASPGGSSGAIQTNNGAGGFGGITPGASVAAFLATPIAGIPATWLQSGAAVANLGFTPPPNTRTVAGTGMLAGGGDLSADRTLNLAAIASNSVVANITGSSAVPTAVALPSCPDTGGNQLNYSSGVFSCDISGGGGGSVSVVGPGPVTVNPASTVTFGSSFAVTDGGGGNAQVSLTTTTNSQAGSTYTILSTDAEKEVLMTNGSATTITMIDGATAGNGFGFGITCNAGCTINRAGSDTINGATSLVLGAFDSAWFRGNGSTAWRASITPPTDPWNATNMAAGTLAVARGGTGLASGTSGGVLAYTASGTLARRPARLLPACRSSAAALARHRQSGRAPAIRQLMSQRPARRPRGAASRSTRTAITSRQRPGAAPPPPAMATWCSRPRPTR